MELTLWPSTSRRRSSRWIPARASGLPDAAAVAGTRGITDRTGDTLTLEAGHRRHADIENTIRDLKYGVGLNHLPSGRFGANAAWLALNVIAHNLSRWVGRVGLGEPLITHKTLRRRYLQLPGRLTSSGRRWTLHFPQRWPWADRFFNALANLRAVVLVT